MKAVIVTGDRYATREKWEQVVASALVDHEGPGNWLFVIQGAAKGIDEIAAGVVNHNPFYDQLPIPAQWQTGGKSAGPSRNMAMLSILSTLKQYGYDVAVLAFHDDIMASKGTKHMTNIALAAGVETWLYRTLSEEPVIRLTEPVWT